MPALLDGTLAMVISHPIEQLAKKTIDAMMRAKPDSFRRKATKNIMTFGFSAMTNQVLAICFQLDVLAAISLACADSECMDDFLTTAV